MSAQYFAELKIDEVVDKERDEFFSLTELEDKLRILKSACQFYLDPRSENYIKRSERGTIDSNLTQLQSLVDTMKSNRETDAPTFASNKQNWLEQFHNHYDELLDRLIRPYQAYSASEDPKKRLDTLTSLITEAESNARSLEEKAAEYADAAADTAETTVGRYFTELLDDGKRLIHRFLVHKRIKKRPYIRLVRRHRGKSFGINSGLTYVRRRWLFLSIALLGVAVGVVVWIFAKHFDGDTTGLTTDDLVHRLLAAIPKILALVVVLLPLRFAIKNYNATSHQRTIYTHKSVVVRTLDAYTAKMDTSRRDEVRQLIAAEIFQTPETGYISRKEGAGSSEIPMEYLLGRISRDAAQ
jgi:hypothetical protein